jgi:hypothetical protein
MVAVFERELSARRNLWLLALATAVIAAISPLLPGVSGYQHGDVLSVSSGTLALALGWGLAVALGSSLFGGELATGRLGFFFSRPVTSFSIWSGRMLAAMALILGSELVVLLPAIVAGNFVPDILEGGAIPGVVAYLVAPILLLLLANAAGIMLRARTPWLVLDLAGVVGTVAAVWLVLSPLVFMGAVLATAVVATATVVVIGLALAAGGLAGLAVGRTGLRRTHGALSLALWIVLGAGLAGLAAYSSWLQGFGPASFDDLEVVGGSADGGWVEVVGKASGRLDVGRRGLLSSDGARWLPIDRAPRYFVDPVIYSGDGSVAAWTRGDYMVPDVMPGGVLWWADLGPTGPTARATTITIGPEASWTLDNTGSRLALLEDSLLSIYGLVEDRLETSVRLPDNLRKAGLFFAGRDRVMAIARSQSATGHELTLGEVNLQTGRVAMRGSIGPFPEGPWAGMDSGAEHLVAWTRSKPDTAGVRAIYALPTGTLVRELGERGFPRLLGDGRVVFLVVDEDGQGRLIVESPEGDTRLVHELGDARDLHLAGEALPGWLLLSRLSDSSDPTQGRRLALLNLKNGEQRAIDGVVRRIFRWRPSYLPAPGAFSQYRDGPGLSSFAVDQKGALVRWDPESGKLVHVVGGK